MKVLTNALGITDSGGLTVFRRFLKEVSSENNYIYIVYNSNDLTDAAVSPYRSCPHLKFFSYPRSNFLKRFWIEHVHFYKIIATEGVDVIYNFSGSAQFLKTPQLIKLQNLMFFSKTLDQNYFNKERLLTWLKQIYFKRLILLNIYRFQHFFEIQSPHVKSAILDFMSERKKFFFIKNDFSFDDFLSPKTYPNSGKKTFLFIVGPHFHTIHKNLEVFVKAMAELRLNGFDFEIIITLHRSQLENSTFWNESLTSVTKFIGYISQEELKKHLNENTILVSTSIVETIGLHVIEALREGCLAIVPNEDYSKDMYGSDLPEFQTNDHKALFEAIITVLTLPPDEVRAIIKKSQNFIIQNERSKLQRVSEIFQKMKGI